jgi:hypothetical protein
MTGCASNGVRQETLYDAAGRVVLIRKLDSCNETKVKYRQKPTSVAKKTENTRIRACISEAV